jgi:hypothetical protein
MKSEIVLGDDSNKLKTQKTTGQDDGGAITDFALASSTFYDGAKKK